MLARPHPWLLLCCFLLPRAASASAAAQAPVDPRSLGLGGATLALPGGALSPRDNPASPAALTRSALAASHLTWLGGTFQDHVAASLVLGRHGVLNAGLGYFSVPDFDSTDGHAAPVSAGLARADLGYAREIQIALGSLALGGLASYFDQRLDRRALRDLELSLGMGWHTPWKPLRLGAAVKQIRVLSSAGSPLAPEFGVGIGTVAKHLSADIDLSRQGEGAAQLRVGAEWRPIAGMALRLGASDADAPGSGLALSAGLGLQGKRWQMNLAWQGRGALGPGMLLSLGTQWGGEAAAPVEAAERPSEATPEAPKPVRSARPAAEESPAWGSGDFELQAETQGQRISLAWPPQHLEMPKTAAYEVLMGMVAEAPLQKAGRGIVQEPHWSGEMAVRGMTYYFRVRVLGQGGEQLGASKVKAVKMP